MKKFTDRINENIGDPDYAYKAAQSEYNDEYTWEYNLQQIIDWDSREESIDDMCFYVKAWLEKIADQEGYKLVKKDRVHEI
jgi:hypothetical protein